MSGKEIGRAAGLSGRMQMVSLLAGMLRPALSRRSDRESGINSTRRSPAIWPYLGAS